MKTYIPHAAAAVLACLVIALSSAALGTELASAAVAPHAAHCGAEDSAAWTWSRCGNRRRGRVVSMFGNVRVVGACQFAHMAQDHVIDWSSTPRMRGDAYARAHGCDESHALVYASGVVTFAAAHAEVVGLELGMLAVLGLLFAFPRTRGLAHRLVRTGKRCARDRSLPLWARYGFVLACAPVPGPFDELVGASIALALWRTRHGATVRGHWIATAADAS